MMKGFYTLVLCIVALVQNQSFSQCAPGPFFVDPSSATSLECAIPETTTNLCEALSLQTQMTIPAGMQVCFIANGNEGSFNLSTCGRTTDDTIITVFDAAGNIISNGNNGCDDPQSLQSFVSFDVPTGATVCVQVESITNGVCDGTNSLSPNYVLEIQCDVSPDGFIQVSQEANQCQTVGFNELQAIIFEDDVTDFNPFVFNTGTTGQMGDYTSGSLTICAQGDINSDEEFWQIDDENGNCVGGIGNTGISCSDESVCTSFNFDGAEVTEIVADGIVSFSVFNLDGEISAFCDTNLLSLELNLCSDPTDIPTMGEWGLICLGLALLSFSIVAIRQQQLILN